MLAQFVQGLLGWATGLITDVISGKKSIAQARKEAAAGYQVTETDSDKELKHWDTDPEQ